MHTSPDSQVPVTRDGFMKPPAPVESGVDAMWLPEEMDMVDWVSDPQHKERKTKKKKKKKEKGRLPHLRNG